MGGRPDWVAVILAGIGQNRSEMTGSLAQTRAEITGRTDRPQEVVTAMRDEDAVHSGAAERAERTALKTREGLRLMGEQITALVRQVRRPRSDVRGIRGEP